MKEKIFVVHIRGDEAICWVVYADNEEMAIRKVLNHPDCEKGYDELFAYEHDEILR